MPVALAEADNKESEGSEPEVIEVTRTKDETDSSI